MARNYRDYFDYGAVYHIYNKVVSGENLFNDPSDYKDFFERYSIYLAPYFDTYAYNLIPNHFHFLVRVKEKAKIDVSNENTTAAHKYLQGDESINFFLENQLARIFGGMALRFNAKNNRVGPLLKSGVKRVLLKTEERVIYQLLYIHHNTIHHGLGAEYDDWKYSSYLAYLSQDHSQLDRDYIFQLLGNKDEFLRLHAQFKEEYRRSNR